jgi:YVTN family beta-propeller protein
MNICLPHAQVYSVMQRLLRTFAVLAALAVPIASYGQTQLYVVNSGSRDITIVDTAATSVTAMLPGPGPLTPIAYNPTDGRLYLPTQEAVGRVFLIDALAAVFVGAPITVGAFPIYITISPELKRAYVSNFFGGVSVIDTTTGGVITEIVGVFSPFGSAVEPQQAKLYVVSSDIASLSVINTNTNLVTTTVAFGCTQPLDIKIDTVLHKAFASNTSCSEVTVFDTLTDTVTGKIALPGRPQFVAVNSETHRAYVTYNNGVPGENGRIGGLAILDTASNTLIKSMTLGKDPTRLALSAPEGRVYITDGLRNSVFVLDTATNTIAAEIPVGSTPVDLAVAPPPLPKLSLSSQSLSFAPQLAGTTSATQTIRARNDGNASLVIQSVFIDVGAFKLIKNTCAGATLLPGSVCDLSVTFTPSAAGPYTATLLIASNDSAGLKSIPISGLGEKRSDANIQTITPVIGQAGSTILIRGGNFGSQQGTGTVEIGGVPATIRAWHSSQIEAVAPAGLSGVVALEVHTSTGTSNAVDFTYAAADVVVWQRFQGPWSTKCDVKFGPLATSPSKPGFIYLGSTLGCGIYASADDGITWNRKNSGLPSASDWPYFPPISRIAIAPSDANTLYVGSFDEDSEAGRIFRSIDGASKWKDASGPISTITGKHTIHFAVQDLAIHPADANSVYAALKGGVYQTADGGQSWKQVVIGNAPDASVNVDNYISARIAPSNPQTVYVAGFTSYATQPLPQPLTAIAGLDAIGVLPLPSLKTVDGGVTWSAIVNPAPVSFGAQKLDALVTDFAISPASENALLASTTSYATPLTNVITKNSGVFKSADGGSVWNPANGAADHAILGSPLVRLVVKPDDANTVLALTGTANTVFITKDGGVTWDRLTALGWQDSTSIFDIGFAGSKLVATTSHGVYFLNGF